MLFWFDDDNERVISFEPVLAGELYGLLRDLKLFNQVSIDPEIHTLVWPNGADFDPETGTLRRGIDYPCKKMGTLGGMISRGVPRTTFCNHASSTPGNGNYTV